MAIRPIRTYPDPVLRTRCPRIEAFDEELRRLAEDMVATMYAAPGVGLAAPQVGELSRLAVVDVSVGEEEGALRVLVNPEITEARGLALDEEGCLSIPGVAEKVSRPAHIKVKAQDLDGRPIELEADELLARVIQHEIDHLDGVLFIDRLTGLRRQRIARQLKREARRQEALA